MTPNDPRSPVWGGLTIALVIAVLFGGLSVVFGWGPFGANALKAGAVVFALMTLLSVPGDLVHIARRTPMAPRALQETVMGLLIAGALVYFAFFAS